MTKKKAGYRTDEPLRDGHLVSFALTSRVAVLLISVIALLATDPYDSSASIAFPLKDSISPLDAFLRRLLRPLSSWDGIYFSRISQFQYEYEQFNAFFPLLPTATNVTASLLGSSYFTLETILLKLGLHLSLDFSAATLTWFLTLYFR